MPIRPGRNGYDSMIFSHNQMMKYLTHRFALLFILLLTLGCSAIGPKTTPTPQPTFTVEVTIAPTPRPTATPTPAPLGSAGNPIKIGYVIPQENTIAIDAAEEIAILLRDQTGFTVENTIFSGFSSLSNAILNDQVDLFWVEPFEYLHLSQLGKASAIVMTNHLGVYAYGVQFIAHAERGFTPFFDTDQSQNTDDFLSAIQQFSGTRPCFISPNSVPGYVVPSGLLSNASTPTLEPVFTYSYNAIIRALFVQGICDFGVSYALIGDPRNTSDILQSIPDAAVDIVTIWQSDGIIPNTALASSSEMPLNIRFQMQEGVVNLTDSPVGLSTLSRALNYEVEGLKAIRDEFYDPLRSVIHPLSLDLEALTH